MSEVNEERIRRWPKIELHLHIEGAAPPALVRRLAARKGRRLEGIFDAAGNYAYRDFLDFLRVYELATSVLETPEDYHALTAAVLAEAAAHGVVYLEAFVSPDFCGGGDLVAWREHVAAIKEAATAAQAARGIVMRVIVTPVRHFGPERARRVARCAAQTAGRFVTGFGIGGDENAHALADFAPAFAEAREAGLRLTAHAGEWAGPESVRAALAIPGLTRIGHGVRAVEDPALTAELAARGTVLEVCPGSNLALGLYPEIRAHPIARLRAAGVAVTVSTDDPPFFATSPTREWALLARGFGWGRADLDALNQVALAAAFCDEETRAAVARRLEEES